MVTRLKLRPGVAVYSTQPGTVVLPHFALFAHSKPSASALPSFLFNDGIGVADLISGA